MKDGLMLSVYYLLCRWLGFSIVNVISRLNVFEEVRILISSFQNFNFFFF